MFWGGWSETMREILRRGSSASQRWMRTMSQTSTIRMALAIPRKPCTSSGTSWMSQVGKRFTWTSLLSVRVFSMGRPNCVGSLNCRRKILMPSLQSAIRRNRVLTSALCLLCTSMATTSTWIRSYSTMAKWRLWRSVWLKCLLTARFVCVALSQTVAVLSLLRMSRSAWRNWEEWPASPQSGRNLTRKPESSQTLVW